MVVALFVVAFAMIVAGLAAVYDGYGIVAVEKGWTKVISGTIAASAGILLMGVMAALVQLRRIGADLAFMREQAGRLDAPLPASQPLEAEEPVPGRGDALAAGAPGSGVENAAGFSPGDVAEKPSPDQADNATPPEAPAHSRAQDVETPAAPHPDSEPQREAGLQPAPSQAASRPEATVVGTYSSGGNTYVMYSDGSIQAQTPTGLYRFDSLDELKAFIASGGESTPPAR